MGQSGSLIKSKALILTKSHHSRTIHDTQKPNNIKKLILLLSFSALSDTVFWNPCRLSPKAPFSMNTSSTTVTYSHHNDHSTPSQHNNPTQLQSNAALTIQSSFRAHRIRGLYRKISTVGSEADGLQRLIQRQETVDAVRSNPLQKLKINESLMALLLTLDSVPGFDPTVREARRKVTRRIVGLQEIIDSVTESKLQECGWWNNYDDGDLTKNWDQFIADMEESVCRDRGGDEMDTFCAEYLGFRCLQRFLREP